MQYFGWDTETCLIVKKGKASRNITPRFVCLTWHDGESGSLIKDRREAVAWWQARLEDPDVTLIAHSLIYDVRVMLRLAREEGVNLWPLVLRAYEDGRLRDTIVRELLIDIASGGTQDRYDLARLERKYFKRDRSASKKGPDVWRKRYAELLPWPVETWPQEAVDYAIDDADGALQVFHAQTERAGVDAFGEPMVEDGDQIVNEHFQTLADFALGLASAHGMATDPEAAQEQYDYYTGVVNERLDELKALGLARQSGTINKAAVQEIVLDGWESIGKDPLLTPKGAEKIKIAQAEAEGMEASEAVEHVRTATIKAVSTDKKKVLQVLQDEGYDDPAFNVYMAYNQATKFLSTYIEPVRDAYPYAICPNYNVLVDSGRTSSSKPNIQNIPGRGKGAELRGCFIPRPGNVFVQCDYSTLEMRTFAQVCLNLGIPSEMAKALKEGKDLHLAFAAILMGISYEKAEKAYKDPTHPQHKEVKSKRTFAKVANFGYPGGLGPKAFVSYAAGYGIDTTIDESRDLRNGWFRAWPEAPMYFEYINACTRVDERVPIRQHGPYGHVEGWRTRLCDRYTSACNTLFQGLAADGIKLAMWEFTKAAYGDPESPLYGFRLCAMIHDELIIEGPEARAEAAAQELSRIMCEAVAVFCPDIPILAEPEIMPERWIKT